MNKLIVFIFLLIPVNVFAYSARNMIAMDMDTNRVLYAKDINSEQLIASISKIMSAIVTIENADLESDVTTTKTILKAFGSAIYIEPGETIKLKDLLYGMMLRSGNDATLAVSEYVFGSVDEFVKMMNEKAKDLGMNNTYFINPHGLEDNSGNGNKSSAYDMAILTSYAMNNPIYREIVATKNYVAKSDKKTYSWTNKNKLLSMYSYITGGKTGYTKKAKRTLVSTACKDNMNVVIVTLNDDNDWDDHINLYERIYKEYKNVKVIDKDNFRVENDYYDKNLLYVKDDVYVMLKDDEEKDISLDILLEKEEDNELVGSVKVKLKDMVLKDVPIYIKKNEDNKSLWQKIKEWFFK